MSMAEKLSFTEYLNSKATLRGAVGNIPQRTVEYDVKKYCKLSVGESKADRVHVPLKPNHKILVDWLYDDPDNPTPLNLRFEGTTEYDAEEHVANWSGERLLKWLMKNAKES
jgi:hypothetical protein